MPTEQFDWVEQGTPMQALEEMCGRADVETTAFHRVYERVLGDAALLKEEPGALMFLEQLLHADTPYDKELLMNGRISTVGAGEDLRVPDDAIPDEIGYDMRRRAAWVVANRTMKDEFAANAQREYSYF